MDVGNSWSVSYYLEYHPIIIVLGDIVATFHRPHPRKEAKPYQVRDARRFLEQIGVTP